MNVVVSGSWQPTNLSQDAAGCVFILRSPAEGFKKIFETFPEEAKSEAMNSAEWLGAI
jgi:hypothetical protein